MDDVFESLAGRALLTQSGTATAKMFGCRALTVGGKAFCIDVDGDVACKLAGGAHAEALATPGAYLFDPSGAGRPMREWVVLPAGRAKSEYEAAMLAACRYVKSLQS